MPTILNSSFTDEQEYKTNGNDSHMDQMVYYHIFTECKINVENIQIIRGIMTRNKRILSI